MKFLIPLILLFVLPFSVAGQQETQELSGLFRSLSNAANDTIRMEIYRNIGTHYYYSFENRDSSNFYLEKALSVAVRLNLKYDEASILNTMGNTQMQQEKYSKSLEYFLKALNIAQDPEIEKTIWHLSPDQSPTGARMLLLSRTYDLIGLLNAYTGNWQINTTNQLKNYREAEKYAKAAENSEQLAYVNFHMGIAYMNEGKLDSAVLLINMALSTFSIQKNQSGSGRALKFLGDTYEKMGKFDLASNTLLKSTALLKETDDQLHLGLGYISLSHVYTDLKKNDSALYYAKESLKIFNKLKYQAWKRDAYNLLTSCFDKLGRTDSAIVYLKLAKSLSDSLSIDERKNLLAFQDVFVEEQEKLHKLEKERIEAREKLRIYLFMSGMVVFTFIVFLLYRTNRVRKKTNELLKQQNKEIEDTLRQLRSTQTQLIQSEKMASLGELTAGIAHEIQNPLNFVNNFSDVNIELIEEMKKELAVGNRQLAEEIAEDIKSNEQKINHHGKRADGIVKGMLQHSRTSSGQKELTDINALADEYLRLAYHGLRAKDKSFNANFETHLDPTLPKLNVIPQDIGRVLLNLINNAFYAVNERIKHETADVNNEPSHVSPLTSHYEPTVTVSTKSLGDKIEISVKDNGNGIPDSIKEKIFQPFFTTKPTGQGTGLGLSLSYDIVKAHGGELMVKSSQGNGSEFTVNLYTA